MSAQAAIPNERKALAASLWTATANPAPECPTLVADVECETVVVGGGFTGLSAALHLAENGQRVVLLEAHMPGWGASGRNGGQVNPGLKANPSETEAKYGSDLGKRMVARSAAGGDLVFDLIQKHGIQCDAHRCGWIRAATNARTLGALRETGRQWRERGHDVEDMDARTMAHHLGADAYRGGIIDRRGGNLHPLNYALGVAEAAERAGARLYGQSRVRRVDSDSETVTVTTDQSTVTAKKALICTNAYTGALMEPLGQSFVPVTSVQVATATLSDNVAQSILPDGHSPSDTRRLLRYFRKSADGRFVMGGRGALRDRDIQNRQHVLRHSAEALYPQLKGVAWEFAWGGDVAITPNHEPGLHRMAPNVVAGLGFNGRGVGMATVMGTLLADWASGMPEEELDFPITSPRPIPFQRFRNIGLGATVATFRLLDRLGL